MSRKTPAKADAPSKLGAAKLTPAQQLEHFRRVIVSVGDNPTPHPVDAQGEVERMSPAERRRRFIEAARKD